MTNRRVFNFNPGPAAIPVSVLDEFAQSIHNHQGSGMSIAEISHRSFFFSEIMDSLEFRIRKLLLLPENYHILFLQGGASLQFAMIPMNFLSANNSADYISTGIWSLKAIHEAHLQEKKINVAASSEDRNFSYIPKNIFCSPQSTYLHLTSNNTIMGTQFKKYPAPPPDVPLVIDMSSDIFARKIPLNDVGMIYASSQKNIGFAGVCLVIIREDLLEKSCKHLPSMLSYRTYSEKKSLYNTPPSVSLYSMNLCLKWLDEKVGGIENMAVINGKKAKCLYRTIDRSNFYRGTAEIEDRSLMNVTFRLPSEKLEKKFIEDAVKENFQGLNGHRSAGGIRASIYNAVTMEGVSALSLFMEHFEKKNG